jgi:predicted enzyme related to lactoylglutathione lyase
MGRPVVYFEIGCKDRAKSDEFYAELFDWELRREDMSTGVVPGEGGIGGHIVSYGHEPHRHTIFYVDVDDLQATLDRAEALGGKTLVPPVEIPGNKGSFAWLADPEGNTIGLYKNPRVDRPTGLG